jgi:hypothetical protein
MKLCLLEAFARQEGGIDADGTIPKRNSRQFQACNPGDIEAGKFATAHGAVGTFGPNGRFARWATMIDGYGAMASLFRLPKYATATIQQAVYLWLGYSLNEAGEGVNVPNEPGNYPAIYVHNVCTWTGLPATEPIAEHLQIPGMGSPPA